MRGFLLAGATVAAMVSPAFAQRAIAEDQRVAITIYNNDLALVEDVRTLDLKTGRQRVEFPGVSAQIQPETALLSADGIEVIEQNFDFDLLTPYKMMEKAIGSTIRLVRTNPATGEEKTETAEVLSANEGIVLRIGDRIEVLRDDGLPVRVLFERIPPNLRARPTLSVTLNSSGSGRKPATLRYLTSGLRWNADYVGVFDEKAGKLELQGWVTLTNQSGVAYTDAKTQLIAGRPGEEAPPPRRGQVRAGMEGPGTVGEELADMRLYTLKAPTTIAENQTKQVSFIDAPNVAARKVYRVQAGGLQTQRRPSGAAVRLAFANSSASGLGEALPAGVLRLYTKDSAGRAQFIGEDRLDHTPAGSELDLAVGDAFDVTSQSTLLKQDAPVKGVTVSEMAYVFRNARSEAVTVKFEQGGIDATHSFLATSAKPVQLDANTYGFTIEVPAKGETRLTFTLRQGTEDKSERR